MVQEPAKSSAVTDLLGLGGKPILCITAMSGYRITLLIMKEIIGKWGII